MNSKLLPNLTTQEESEILCAIAFSIEHMRTLAKDSSDNKNYWLGRAEDFSCLYEKICSEIRTAYQKVS